MRGGDSKLVRDNVDDFTRYLVFCNPIVFLWGHRLVPTHHGCSLSRCDMDKNGGFSDENGSRTEQRSHVYVYQNVWNTKSRSSGRGVVNVLIGLFVIGGPVGGCVGRSGLPLNWYASKLLISS